MRLTDQQIQDLVDAPKPAVDAAKILTRLAGVAVKNRQRLVRRECRDERSRLFTLIVRQSDADPQDFSVILVHSQEGDDIILRRHNGPSHPHKNKIENERLAFVCHRHFATHRYQERGFEAEGFAEQTTDFVDVASALACMLGECGFAPDDTAQLFLA